MNRVVCSGCKKPIPVNWEWEVGNYVSCSLCNTPHEVIWCNPYTIMEITEDKDLELLDGLVP